MPILAVKLVLVSTVMHAAWNLLVRGRGGAQACIWRMQVTTICLGAVPAIYGYRHLLALPATALCCVAGAGCCCGLYYVSLARGYEAGDFTTVYPAARALPVLVLGLGDIVLGHPPSWIGWLGMALVAGGCLLVPLARWSDFRLQHYRTPATVWILLTAAGTTGYSLLDKVGTATIARGPAATAAYCYLFVIAAALSYWPLRRLLVRTPQPDVAVGWLAPATAGALCYLAYWLVLCAYQLCDQVSYVVAFRQFSIVIGVIAGIVIFREPGGRVRLTGALVITAGLLLLELFS